MMNDQGKTHKINPEDFRQKIKSEIKSSTYQQLAYKYGINQYYIWQIVNNEDYQLPEWLCERFDIEYYRSISKCKNCNDFHDLVEECGTVKKQKRKTRKSKPRFRIDLPYNIPEEQKVMIRNLKPEQRLKAIIAAIQENQEFDPEFAKRKTREP